MLAGDIKVYSKASSLATGAYLVHPRNDIDLMDCPKSFDQATALGCDPLNKVSW